MLKNKQRLGSHLAAALLGLRRSLGRLAIKPTILLLLNPLAAAQRRLALRQEVPFLGALQLVSLVPLSRLPHSLQPQLLALHPHQLLEHLLLPLLAVNDKILVLLFHIVHATYGID